MKIEISRSFSKKIQLKQYEPIEFFCAAKAEVEVPDPQGSDSSMSYGLEKALLMKTISETLDGFVQSEVEKSANKFKVADKKKISDVSTDEAEHDTELLIEE